MRPDRPTRPPRRLLAPVLLLGALGCQARPEPPRPPEPAPERADEVVRMDPGEAARLAAEIRAEAGAWVADGLSLDLWATEHLLGDPTTLSVDALGRVYVARTNRADDSEFDIRGYPHWMVESISLRTVEDRRAFLRRELAPERSERNDWLSDQNGDGSHDWRDLAVTQEHILRLEDSDGDGTADLARRVFAGFDTEVSDVVLGVLAHGRDLFVSVAPDLWRLRDEDGDGRIEAAESLSHGYGVHIGFGGHGLSGPTVGPDGRLYWSIGDVGMDVVDREGRRWAYPNQGVIVRSELDGSGFEVFAAGLRNVHEFAFDELGNLISVDNDGDHEGELERLVYIVEGSDSGWRTNWQFGKYVDPANNGYKVWMEEGLYRPRFPGQAAYITPPLASYDAGPAGFAYNPGTALSEEWRNFFFVAEYTGSSATGKVHAFRLREQGAGFELAEEHVPLGGVLATGLDFGPDGALYLSDWIEGWGTKDRGRVWKLDVPDAAGSALREETRRLLAEDFGPARNARLAALLRHPDQRVRQKAQFALAERGAAGVLLQAARQTEHRLARLHGMWGTGQLARRDTRRARPLLALLGDRDPEIRAQAARVLGDVRYAPAGDALIPLLRDEAPRVRFFAAQALGRIGHAPAVRPLLAMLEENDDRDTFLRHAGALALARIGQAEPLIEQAGHPSRALRLAAVVALRRLRHPGVAAFLADPDEAVVTEAARAINDDESIEAALPALARTLEEERFTGEALLRRAISANVRLGTEAAARRLAAFAGRPTAGEELRVEALASLGTWPRPSVLDRVDGTHRGSVTRDPDPARAALAALVEPLFDSGTPAVRTALAQAVGRVGLSTAAPALLARIQGDAEPAVRTAALRALHALGDARTEPALRAALADGDAGVRMAALSLLPDAGLPTETVVQLLSQVLERGELEERQAALATLGGLATPEAAAVLAGQLRRMAEHRLPVELHLDLEDAVRASGDTALARTLAAHQANASVDDPLGAYRVALGGGDAAKGQRIVFRHPGAQCARCHGFGDSGPAVGPNLRAIGARLDREELLRALVDPGARLAPGFGSVALTLRDGRAVTGLLLEEDEAGLVVRGGDGQPVRVAKSELRTRTNLPSAMPPMGGILTRHELRDVVEYLATLR